MVLPVRIELTTSALPRMRSTTELRQHSARAACPTPRGSGPFAQGQPVVKADAAGLSHLAMNDAEKKARLAAALRENLRKRKAQARAVGDEVRTAPEPKDGPSD